MISAPVKAIARRLRHVLPAFALLYVVILGLGLLVTRTLAHRWPVDVEDGVNRSLAAHRTPRLNAITWALSEAGNTLTVVLLVLVVMVVFRQAFRRWHEALFVLLATWSQSIVFLLVQLVISRDRPGVPHLDPSPPTSSFPSGHTGAAVALYGSTAAVLLWRTRRGWLPRAGAALLVLLPILVAYSRLYRGMHYPTDVLSSAVNGLSCIAISWRAFLGDECGLAAHLDPLTDRWRRTPAAARDGDRIAA